MNLVHALHPVPDLLALHGQAPQRYPMLLESVASGTTHGRWDLLLVAQEGGSPTAALTLGADGITRDGAGQALEGRFLSLLDQTWIAARVMRDERRWPFRGGWALMLGYELAQQIEPTLGLPQRDDAMPVAVALRCPAAILHDRTTGEGWVVAEEGCEALVAQVLADVATVTDVVPAWPAWPGVLGLEEDAPARFVEGVHRILDYLVAGDIFQVNLSRAWHARLPAPASAAQLYARLRTANPAPFAGLFVQPDWAVVSSSPERLVSVRGEMVETRPIAGTRARFEGDDDADRIRELVGHPKERAEHVMLIDLERNDLGRLCTPGSVAVDELMTVESYAHVHHIVSNVRGVLRQGVTPGEVIGATFPGGTITGCPKVRCMEIIAELEQTPRGAYTGAFGWLNRDGDLDLNILIRTAELQRTQDGHRLNFRTGAGIVADSDPARELEETRAKARGVLRAL
ncbi:MAG: aminodeoxychorismate synthase component I [Pseudoxanthomonas sp.]